MDDSLIKDVPLIYSTLLKKCDEIGFTMPSDIFIGTLLKTLISSKPNGHFLELGTGIGLSLSWMIEGLDIGSDIISIDNDPKLIEIAQSHFRNDERVNIICTDGSEWIKNYEGEPFDLVFADAWPGKYSEIDEILELIKVGGFYVIDDMNPQPNWPEGHAEKVSKLIDYLENREDFVITKMNWSTGVIIAIKK